MTTSTTTTNENKYFNLHTSGLGYVNRIRTVKPKNGTPFLACSIAALYGRSDSLTYVYYDVRVSGEKAQELIERCKEAVDAKQKVLIGFRIGDAYPEVFTYETGKKEGEQGLNMKGRLLHVSWIKVDNVMEYKAEPKSKDEGTDTSVVADKNAPASENYDDMDDDIPF